MRKSKNYTIIFLFVFSCLIYLLYRDNMILNQWIGNSIYQYFHASEFNILPKLPDWVIYNLPDAIWAMTLIYLLMYIWNFSISKKNFPWLVSPAIIACSIEFGQKFDIIKGTYDVLDLVFIIIASLIPFIEIIKIKYYEKAI